MDEGDEVTEVKEARGYSRLPRSNVAIMNLLNFFLVPLQVVGLGMLPGSAHVDKRVVCYRRVQSAFPEGQSPPLPKKRCGSVGDSW